MRGEDAMGDGGYDYDMVVIGSGPGGQRAAIQAAKLRRRVAIVERRPSLGGNCITQGTIPSKTLREAVLYLSGYRERAFYGESYSVKSRITMADLQARCGHVIQHETEIVRHQLRRNGVEVIAAGARLDGPHRVHLGYSDGSGERSLSVGTIVLAVGTSPSHPAGVEVDSVRVLDSDGVVALAQIPHTAIVVGAGVIGCEYASMLATLGVRVTLVDSRPRLLPFIDGEIAGALEYQLRSNRLAMRLGETVAHVERNEGGVVIQTESGKQIVAECAVFCAGRRGSTGSLGLDSVGITPDPRGLIPVDAEYRTTAENIYAVGDVIGFPSLASTSMEQGRAAALHAFGMPVFLDPAHAPYGIYTIPEVSMVGRTEEELTAAGVPYEVGVAQFKEIARGQIIGDSTGMLKLLFHLETHALLGVHIIGEGASELIHVGQAVLALGGTVDYFVNAVFNYPTLAEAYKVAALAGLNRRVA
jgi:NAD(P) transhydrogenase